MTWLIGSDPLKSLFSGFVGWCSLQNTDAGGNIEDGF